MKSQLGLLVRLQWKGMWNPGKAAAPAKGKRADIKPMLGQRKGVVKPTPRAGRGSMPIAVVTVILAVCVTSLCYPIAAVLHAAGLLYILPAVTMAASCVMSLVTTIYKTNGLLFGFKDYDSLMSLPVKTGTVITSRIMILYLLNLFYCAVTMAPTGVIYSVFASPPAGFYPVYVLCVLLVPLVPVVIAAVIGTLVAWIAAHFKRKTGASVIFTVAAMIVWLLFCMNMSSIAANFAQIGPSIVAWLNRIYPLSLWFTRAVTELDALSLLLFAGVSAGIYALFVAVVARRFKQINSTITSVRTSSDYKMREMKQSSPRMALFKKEWKRFTSSSAYLLNAGIGVILLVLFAVIVAVFGTGAVEKLLSVYVPDPETQQRLMPVIATYIPIVMSFFTVITCPAAASVSLEGKSLWIVRSLPIRTKDILLCKLWMNLSLVGAAVLVSGTIFNLSLRANAVQAFMMYAVPLAYGAFSALLGLKLNLSYPRLDWESEVVAVKQGAPVMVVTLLGMALIFVPGILSLFAGGWVVWVCAAALAVVCLFLYRGVMGKGVRRFESLE